MKIITVQEQVVSYEYTKKLFEAGIDIPTNDYYYGEKHFGFKMTYDVPLPPHRYNAPRASQLLLLLKDKLDNLFYRNGLWCINVYYSVCIKNKSLPDALAEALIELVKIGEIKIEKL